MVFGQTANITPNSIIKGLKLQILINCQNKERDIPLIAFDDRTVKIFSSKNATTGCTKSFLFLIRLSFKFV